MKQKNTKKNKIELLCPAGDLERLKTAVVFGADAVYCGLPSWSLRNAREITFDFKTLKEGIEFAHKHKVRVYLTFNIFPHESQIEELERNLKEIKKKLSNIDGVIVSDLGMLSLVKKYLPKTEIHISTQANTLNSEAILAWGKLGAKRVVLARELTLKEIKEIKKKLIIKNCNLEVECFGHGAMCMAYSGRCLLSKYFTGREANLGDCAQSCRWRYRIKTGVSSDNVKSDKDKLLSCHLANLLDSGEIKNKITKYQDNKFYIEEETRPGDLIEVQEDSNGTYFMNSKEICSIDIIDKFIESGIDSLKIEGRAKTVYYLATVTRAYRKAIDLYYAGKLNKKTIKELYAELNLVQNRGYSHGFLLSKCGYEQEYDIAAFKPPVIFLGVFVDDKGLIEVKNKFQSGEDVEIVTPDKIYRTKILEIKDKKGKILKEILTPQEKVWARFDTKATIPARSILRKRIK